MDHMKTYTIEELEYIQKSRLDYVEEHQKMLTYLRNTSPAIKPDEAIWSLTTKQAPFWTLGNIIDEDGKKQEGSGFVPKTTQSHEI
jgi:hypothetical protein